MPLRTRWANLENRLAEAPFETPIAAWFAGIGWAALISGQGIVPATLADALPAWLVLAWTVGLALGGTLTVAGVLRRSYRQEQAGLAFLGYGVTLYGGVLVGVISGSVATAAAAMFAIAFGCLIRLRVLARAKSAGLLARDVLRRQEGDQ